MFKGIEHQIFKYIIVIMVFILLGKCVLVYKSRDVEMNYKGRELGLKLNLLNKNIDSLKRNDKEILKELDSLDYEK